MTAFQQKFKKGLDKVKLSYSVTEDDLFVMSFDLEHGSYHLIVGFIPVDDSFAYVNLHSGYLKTIESEQALADAIVFCNEINSDDTTIGRFYVSENKIHSVFSWFFDPSDTCDSILRSLASFMMSLDNAYPKFKKILWS